MIEPREFVPLRHWGYFRGRRPIDFVPQRGIVPRWGGGVPCNPRLQNIWDENWLYKKMECKLQIDIREIVAILCHSIHHNL